MAILRVHGPFTWTRPIGENAFEPGEEHAWFVRGFTLSMVYQASAHPRQDQTVQQLAVLSLSTTYEHTGGPLLNFVVRNVGPSAVFSYRLFVTGVEP